MLHSYYSYLFVLFNIVLMRIHMYIYIYVKNFVFVSIDMCLDLTVLISCNELLLHICNVLETIRFDLFKRIFHII